MDNFVDNVDNFYSVEVNLASICGISKVIYTLYIDAFPLYIADKSVVFMTHLGIL